MCAGVPVRLFVFGSVVVFRVPRWMSTRSFTARESRPTAHKLFFIIFFAGRGKEGGESLNWNNLEKLMLVYFSCTQGAE